MCSATSTTSIDHCRCFVAWVCADVCSGDAPQVVWMTSHGHAPPPPFSVFYEIDRQRRVALLIACLCFMYDCDVDLFGHCPSSLQPLMYHNFVPVSLLLLFREKRTTRCGPCRGFTPDLVKTYNAVRAAGKEFEVVLVGSDRNEADFLEYHKGMPWRALPFPDRSAMSLIGRVLLSTM